MPFSFLNPWFWLGALAVAAPIYLHLLRKRPANLVRFSAVRFLRDQLGADPGPWLVRDWLLLGLRLLAVLLLVAGFSWPYWLAPQARGVQQSVVYILDNTLSRQVDHGFITDRERVVRALQSRGPATRVAVIELAGEPRVLVRFDDDPLSAAQKLRALQPSYQHGLYAAAFRQAGSLLSDAPGISKRIVLLGDNQANQWVEDSGTLPVLSHVQLELPKTRVQQLPNLWLAEPDAQRIFLGSHSRVNLAFRLGHLGPARTARVLVRANDRLVLSRVVDLEKEPENVLIRTQFEAAPTDWVRIEARVEGAPDSLSGDDALFCTLPPVRQGSVAVLARSPYLRLALSPEVMRGQWNSRQLDPGRIEDELRQDRPADVLCLESTFLQSTKVRALVVRYLGNGLGVFLIVNELSPVVDQAVRELGFEPDGITNVAPADAGQFPLVFADHSAFQSLDSADFGIPIAITVSRYARLRQTAGRPLILSPSGTGLLFEDNRYPGKLFVCAFGLERQDTSWPVHPSFIPFLDLTLQAARPQEPIPTSFEPGQAALIPLAQSAGREISLRDKGREILRVPVDHGQVRLRLPDHPGIYEMTGTGSQGFEAFVSINVPAAESELVFTASPEAVKTWGLSAPRRAERAGRTAAHGVGFSGILRQQIWWWMIVCGLLALLLETAFAQAKGEKL